MLNIIKYNLFRIGKQTSTYIFLVLSLICGIGVGILTGMNSAMAGFSAMAIEVSIIFSGIVIALFLTTEFKDGIVRNQLITGNSHKTIFIADSLTACIVGCTMWLIYIIPYLITVSVIGIRFETLGLVLGLFAGILSVCCACCLFTFISFMTKSAHGIILCILLSSVLCIFAALMTSPLSSAGVIQEPALTIILTCIRTLPITQLTIAETFSVSYIWVVFIASAVFIAIFELVGIFVFKHSDLK